MVFTPTKLAPLNVFDYKVERLLNLDRLQGATKEDLEYSRNCYSALRIKIKSGIKLTDNEFLYLELLNKVM